MTKIQRLRDAFAAFGCTGDPRLIDCPAKAKFLTMFGVEAVWKLHATPAYYCFNDGRLADTFDTEADAASYVRDHGGYYASDLTDEEEGLVASDRAERRANP